ncbi:MAG: winged helix-turn-helix transcriptional regulator [Nanoarchaeota archaeon]|nr:winged helix-turn-helix transcriptional regulator [Nanoarchaeota archaeon]
MIPKESAIENQALFERIRLISNPKRFKIIELTQENQLSITELSSKLKLAYNKCADYVKMLEQLRLIQKNKMGKEVRIRSKVKLSKNKIELG